MQDTEWCLRSFSVAVNAKLLTSHSFVSLQWNFNANEPNLSEYVKNVTLSLWLIKQSAVKSYGEVDVQHHNS
jgi:hypothetical protein